MNVDDIARIAHEINRSYCSSISDWTQVVWEEAPLWQRESTRNGVLFHLANPHASPSDSHNNWLKEKLEQGWQYGPVKNAVRKEHPCIMDYGTLPHEQQTKDHLFLTVVNACRRYLDPQ